MRWLPYTILGNVFIYYLPTLVFLLNYSTAASDARCTKTGMFSQGTKQCRGGVEFMKTYKLRSIN